jgi:hypothetical protein
MGQIIENPSKNSRKNNGNLRTPWSLGKNVPARPRSRRSPFLLLKNHEMIIFGDWWCPEIQTPQSGLHGIFRYLSRVYVHNRPQFIVRWVWKYWIPRKSNFRYSNRNFPIFRLTFLGTIPHLETHPGRRARVTTTSLLDTHICWTTGCKAAVEHASNSEFQHLNSLSPWLCLKMGTPKWQSEEEHEIPIVAYQHISTVSLWHVSNNALNVFFPNEWQAYPREHLSYRVAWPRLKILFQSRLRLCLPLAAIGKHIYICNDINQSWYACHHWWFH